MMKSDPLLAYICKQNAETLAWCKRGEGRWAMTLVEELDHWHSIGIHTPAELDFYLAACCYVDVHKSAYGYKPGWPSSDSTTLEELEEWTAQASKYAEEANLRLEESIAEFESEEAAHDAAVREAMTPSPAFTLGELL